MFNLEKFQAEFKAGRFDEFHYYSTLAKELTRTKETVSIAHLSVSRAEQLDSIAFDRFVNITGEKDNFECSLLIDTETGYLYSPQWFNTNNRTFATIHDYETFVAQQVIAGFNDWELVDNEDFENFEPKQKIKWFDSSSKNKVILNKINFFCYLPAYDETEHSYKKLRFKKNELVPKGGVLAAIYGEIELLNHSDACSKIGINPNEWIYSNNKLTFVGVNKTFIRKYYFINKNESSINEINKEFYFLGGNKEISKKISVNTYYNDISLLTTYFPNYTKNEKIYTIGEAYPFIYSRHFVDLELWGNKFSTSTFIQFLVDNNFDTSFLPKAPNLIPYILESLQKTTGIRLHEDTITFPSRLFKHESAISKHQNLIAYLDFLLWKIEYYAQSHASELTKSNQLYGQLANLKTDNAELSNIQQYLLKKFDFSLQNLEEKLLQFKSESIAYLEKIDCIDSVWQYAENQPSIDFNLIGEAVTRLFNNQIIKVTQFSASVEFLTALFGKVNALFTANQHFITAQKEQFRLNCEKAYVDDSFADLFTEWQTEITALENHYFPIIEACFIGTISQSATIETLSLFENYRYAVDNFFLTERIVLIHEYDENPKSAFLQKIDMESKLFKSRCALRNGLKALITNEAQHLTKKLLNAESQSLLTRQVDNLLTISKEANISQVLQTEFNELQQRNFEIYLADVEQYGNELDKRDKDIQSLLFKMKKDLERQPKRE
ncbi:MAG: hypothetical protein WCK96_04780 [Methylococcales bacterium]